MDVDNHKRKQHKLLVAEYIFMFLYVISVVVFVVLVAFDKLDYNEVVGIIVALVHVISLFVMIYITIVYRIQERSYKRNKKKHEKEDEKETSSNVENVYKYVINVNEMTGIQFERYCAVLLKQSYGFVRIEFTKTSGDYGGDLVGYHKDGSKWVIQCKRYRNHVGREAVQEVLGARYMYGADKMAVMTNNVLTSNAKNLANASGVVVFENLNGVFRTNYL